MLKWVVAGAMFMAAMGALNARPFAASDLARLERISDPHVSPDGRFVAYNIRSTAGDANRVQNALGVLERSAAGAAPRERAGKIGHPAALVGG